ncbi:DUF2339 domain-containing protein [Wenzhouxiangella sp. AB-CW3]|uniref:DUF2339 domain-containing protein n=1 Tax=Wenzhouxiangella sp. AB-CW3 TaxID=2771012 RepID=UPI00168A7160|nr:DUF2339 domain-containing protein [Wenzhouxiangella sp. AB-CW3]QOC22386.1 DUF2339 domain-containing protein [Wenzhouxiangella sp. AB-CW3]
MQSNQSNIGTELVVLTIVGALLGLAASGVDLSGLFYQRTGMVAAAIGALMGALWAVVLHQGRRISQLEQRLARRADSGSVLPVRPAVETPSPRAASADAPESRHQAAATGVRAARVDEGTSQASGTTAPKPQRADSPGLQQLKRWFTTGNVPVKIGVLVSFVGLAALLRYAGEQGWLKVPVEWRLLGVALLAVAALLFGVRQVEHRRAFALSLQGGAIGTVLLTVFAAFRLYQLLPASVAFSLMVVMVAVGGVLATVQKAIALAVLAMIAGFAAPMLVSTGEGSHVALFSWYAVLNLGIFAIAWRQSWPVLNRVGFVFTFAIATLWGVLAWSPVHYASVQAFLILFFTLYFLIPILEAWRGQRGSRWLDVILVFGLPLFVLPLQILLLEGERMAIAGSTLAMALVYLTSSVLLLRRWNMPMLGRSHAVLAVCLATLAVPFAFSGFSITLIWALEGAALVWFGCLQQQRLTRLSGLGLQGMAAGVWLVNQAVIWPAPELMLVNKYFLGGLAVAVAGVISAWRYDAAGARGWRLNVLLVWALLIWSINGLAEMDRHLVAAESAAAMILFLAVSACLAAYLHFRKTWTPMAVAAVLFMASCPLLLPEQVIHGLPLAGWGLPAWVLVLVAILATDYWFGKMASRWRGWAVMVGHAAVVAALSVTAVELASSYWQPGRGWFWLLGGLPLLLLGAWRVLTGSLPLCFRPLPEPQLLIPSAFIVMALLAGAVVSLTDAGSAAPLPWLPLINPLELAQVAALVVLLALSGAGGPGVFRLPLAVPAMLGLLLATQFGMRSVHHLAGVDWSVMALATSNVAQATLSVIWTLLGVLAWVAGSRRRQVAVWWAGAILLALVLLKLLLIDRQFLSTVAGILSFLAFGMLSILVGYLAPAPPLREAEQRQPRP